MVLVDTSVWIDHFRHGDSHLRQLLRTGRVSAHAFVIGELACGSLVRRSEILELLRALPQANSATHAEVITFINRQRLYGKGLGLIDVHLLAAALLSDLLLWTRDKTLIDIARVLRVAYEP